MPLVLRENLHHCHALAESIAELQGGDIAFSDGDHLAGMNVPGRAALAVLEREGPKPAELDGLPLRDMKFYKIQKGLNNALNCFVGEIAPVSDVKH